MLQEAAAARSIQIKCGSTEIDGYVFCLGLKAIRPTYILALDWDSKVGPLIKLIEGATLRPRDSAWWLNRESLEISPLGDLIDMFRYHEATERHDKIFSLLGMSCEGSKTTGLAPDYTMPWETLMENLVKHLLGPNVAVKSFKNSSLAIIKSQGLVLARICHLDDPVDRYGTQSVTMTYQIPTTETSKTDKKTKRNEFRGSFPQFAEKLRYGDLLCLMEGRSNITIVRPQMDYFTVIAMAVHPTTYRDENSSSTGVNLSKILQLPRSTSNEFLLAWNWEKEFDSMNHPKHYETLVAKIPELQLATRSQLDISLTVDRVTRLSTLAHVVRLWAPSLAVYSLFEAKEALKIVMEDQPNPPEQILLLSKIIGNEYELARGLD